MFEYLNSPSTVAPVSFATCGGFAKSRSGDKTFAQQYAGTTDELREIVDEVRRYMVEQGDNVSENELKLYLAIKNVCNRFLSFSLSYTRNKFVYSVSVFSCIL